MRFTWLDWSVVLLYLLGMISIGLYQSRRQKTTSEYFQAGKTMKWLMFGISMLAGTTSAMDFISQPSNVIQYGFVPLASFCALPLIYPYIFYIALPFWRRVGVVSVYEYIEKRFDNRVRILTAGIFMGATALVIGIAIYVPCLTIVGVTENDPWVNQFSAALVQWGFGEKDPWLTFLIVVFGIIATLYTALSGMRGVIWGGVMMSFILFAALASQIFYLMLNLDGGLATVLESVKHVGIYAKDNPPFQFSMDGIAAYLKIPYTYLGLLLIGILGGVNTYSCNQPVIQRFSSTHSVRDAQRGFLMSILGTIVSMLLLVFLGVGLYAFYVQKGGGELPAVLQENPDKIVPYFISEVFPHGFAGLIIAAVLSLGLGGYSASLNSLATVTMVDLVNLVVPRFRRGDPQSPKFQHAQVFWSKALTVAFGALAVLIAWQAQNFGKIIDISMSLAFTFFGPVLGIFVSGIFWRRATSRGVFWAGLISACVGLYFMVFTAPKLYEAGGLFHFMASIMPDASVEGYKPLSRQWIMTLGVIGFFIPAFIFSLFSKPEPAEKQALTYWEVRKRPLEAVPSHTDDSATKEASIEASAEAEG